MPDTGFVSLFTSMLDLFQDCIDNFKPFVTFITYPLEDLDVVAPWMPDWILALINSLLSSFDLGDNISIISFMIGVGVPVYAMATFIKYVKNIFFD